MIRDTRNVDTTREVMYMHNESYIDWKLSGIGIGCTAIIYGHCVTRWAQNWFEVGTHGTGNVLTIELAKAKIKTENPVYIRVF